MQPPEGAVEVGVTVQDVDKGGHIFPDLGKNLPGSVLVGHYVWVGDVGDDTAHWEGLGWISPQGGLQADVTASSEGKGRELGVSHTGGSDGGGGVTRGGDLHLPSP